MVKNIVLDSLFRLKHIEAKFRNVTISHDMTVTEKECKNLIEEAKKKPKKIPWENGYIK